MWRSARSTGAWRPRRGRLGVSSRTVEVLLDATNGDGGFGSVWRQVWAPIVVWLSRSLEQEGHEGNEGQEGLHARRASVSLIGPRAWAGFPNSRNGRKRKNGRT